MHEETEHYSYCFCGSSVCFFAASGMQAAFGVDAPAKIEKIGKTTSSARNENYEQNRQNAQGQNNAKWSGQGER